MIFWVYLFFKCFKYYHDYKDEDALTLYKVDEQLDEYQNYFKADDMSKTKKFYDSLKKYNIRP